MIELLELAEKGSHMTRQVGWIVGLLTCVCGALIGQAELLGEPYRHYVTVLFVVGTAISGYMVRPAQPKE